MNLVDDEFLKVELVITFLRGWGRGGNEQNRRVLEYWSSSVVR